MKKKILFLINPHAGKSEIRNYLLDIIDLFTKKCFSVTTRTTHPSENNLKEDDEQYDLIVCCGGDGTLNQAVNEYMKLKSRPLFGYIPGGTVNDFAASLGLSRNPLEAAEEIMNGSVFACDIGLFNEKYFTYVAAFGAFTEVSYQTPQQAKNILGRIAYILEGIKQLPNIKSYHILVEHSGGSIEDDFTFGMITNSSSVGGFQINNKKDIFMDDGLFEVTLVKSAKNLIERQMIINSLLHQEADSNFIYTFKTDKLHIVSETDIPWTLDGEFGGSLREVCITNKNRALNILTV